VSAGDDLGRLARASQARASAWSVAGLAAEAGPEGLRALPARTHRAVEPAQHASVASFLARCGSQATGPGLEPKLRVVSFARAGDGALEVELAPTSWELGRGFHMALLACSAPPPEAAEWLAEAFAGHPITPGLAAVHGVVLTRDRKLVLMRRAADVLYRPSHWAATFEEQMVADDLVESDAIAGATLRGVHEELGVPPRLARCTFLSALVELETLNIAFLSRIDVAFESRELLALARSAPDARDADRIDFVDAEPSILRALAESGGGASHAPLHPTSALRLELLARQLELARP